MSRIAVIGVGGLWPDAPDAHTFWRNVAAGHDAISELPEGRWDPVFYDPASPAIDRVYCKRGGFLGSTVPFDAGAFGIMPVAAAGAEPDQLLALQVAAATFADAGVEPDDAARAATTVVLGRGSYVTPGMIRLEQQVRTAQQVVTLLDELVPGLDPSVLDRVRAELRGRHATFGPDTAIGLVPNLTASRIANRLDLLGPAYTLDAACASSLLAVEHGVRELRSGRARLALVGGVHTTQDITFWSVFSQLGALSRSQRIRPFSAEADGLLIGEGIGMLLLERLDDALAADRRIYAVIDGVGSASDGRAASVMVPRVAGQVLALRRAWEDAGLDPRTVGLVEAHGTATAAGDAAELETLAEVFGPADGPRTPLGSVKSMIGHAMPAAGAAGLIKAVLALHHQVIPPSLHADPPADGLAPTRFRVPAEAEPWTTDRPRVAAVNAFGFGGIDAHVVLSEAPRPRRRPRARPPEARREVLALAAPTQQALLDAVREGRTRGGAGPWRLAALDPTQRDRLARVVEKGKPWRGRGDIWFTGEPLGAGGVAVMFPGVEARFEPDLDAIAEAFDQPRPRFSRPADLEETGMGLVESGRLVHHVLETLDVPIAAYAGHSVGEWTAMICSGLIARDEADRFIGSLQAGSLEVPGVLFAAAATSAEVAAEALAGLPDVAVSHDNCPRQILLCGAEESVHVARDRLVARGVMVQVLPFRSGFHSPLFAPYLDGPRALLAGLTLDRAAAPLWSATLAAPFPTDDAAIRSVAMRHLTEPVRFRELTEALYADGVRIFVQAGTGSLTGFVDDTLRDRPHLSVSALHAKREGLDQVRALALALWVEGVPVDLDRAIGAAPEASRTLTVQLDLRAPLLHAEAPLDLPRSRPTLDRSTPVLAALDDALAAVDHAARDVVEALGAPPPRPRALVTTRRLSLQDDPYLIDHAFFPQPDDWPDPADRYPVVPMTMMLELLLDQARALRPDRVPVRVEDLRAFKWLGVLPPVEVRVEATEVAPDVLEVRLDGYCEARVLLAPAWPSPPEPSIPPLDDPRPAPLTPAQLYGERWMFHGPAYQGITTLGPWSEVGIEGVITTPEAPGALIDNAGQIFGYWLMVSRELDRMALPVSLARIERYGPHPAPGTPVDCRVRITTCTDDTLACDLELLVDGRVWCRILDWADRRFANDPHMWRVMRQPEHVLLADEGEGWVVFDEPRRRIPSREWISRCFLVEAERQEMLAAGPRRQREWLNARIAAKDAVRAALAARGVAAVFPSEVVLTPAPDAPEGHLEARTRRAEGLVLHVAVATTDRAAAARATEVPGLLGLARVGEALPDPGALEADLLASAPRADELAARVLAARRALGGAASAVVDAADGERLRVAGRWLRTTLDRDLALAWTDA